jgi:2-dehydropantoate 2-reductase
MGKRVAFVGGGAIGGFVGSYMAKAGEDVTLIDGWADHVNYVREHGMQVSGLTEDETASISVNAIHVSDIAAFSKQQPIDIAFISVKSYDTEWATKMIAPYLAPDGFIVSLQNCINEETIAATVGMDKTLGVVVSRFGVELYGPGHIRHTSPKGTEASPVFRVGEVHGRITPRAEQVAALLSLCDRTKVTTNLWGERWSKLVLNAMGSALPAVTGLSNNGRDRNEVTRAISIRLSAEAVRVAQALGYKLEKMDNMEPETFTKAADGVESALSEVTRNLLASTVGRSEDQRTSMAQDVLKGRRTETDSVNGYVAARGEAVGVPAPTNAKVHLLVKRVESGELKPDIDNVRDV